MRKTATTRATAKSGDRKGATDWTRVRAMSDAQVRKAALADQDAQPLTKEQLSKMRGVSRVKALRETTGTTQRERGCQELRQFDLAPPYPAIWIVGCIAPIGAINSHAIVGTT